MAGMIDESMDTIIEHKDDEFQSKSLMQKIWVLSAGVLMNTLLALFVFSLLGFYNGVPQTKDVPIVLNCRKYAR